METAVVCYFYIRRMPFLLPPRLEKQQRSIYKRGALFPPLYGVTFRFFKKEKKEKRIHGREITINGAVQVKSTDQHRNRRSYWENVQFIREEKSPISEFRTLLRSSLRGADNKTKIKKSQRSWSERFRCDYFSATSKDSFQLTLFKLNFIFTSFLKPYVFSP